MSVDSSAPDNFVRIVRQIEYYVRVPIVAAFLNGGSFLRRRIQELAVSENLPERTLSLAYDTSSEGWNRSSWASVRELVLEP